nr:enoyl-CoA hydratase/isomerase family protein [Oceanococcus sp. HetDA_MAG_MS8]
MSITRNLDADGILTLTLDMPGRSMNVLNEELTDPFAQAIADVESDDSIKGVILTSGKKEFLAGADIDKVFKITDPQEAYEASKAFQALIRRLETTGKPVVAALNGTALGGGLELALACHYRVALNNPKAKFGLPEVKLGLLPGGGGTQRLPRMMGLQKAMPFLLEGKELRVDAAKAQGWIDAIADTPEDMLAQAKAWCVANPKASQPWDQKGFKIPGGDPKHPAVVQMLAIAPSMLRDKTQGLYPAPQNIMSCVFEGCLVDFDTGCDTEARYFANCVVSQVAKNTIGTFWYGLNEIKKGASRPAGVEKSRFTKVGVLGAGMMGAGITYVSAKAGFETVVKDVSQEGADKGKAYAEGIVQKLVGRNKMTKEAGQELLNRITPTASADDLAGCDLIIEAVFEDRELKAQVTKESEEVMAAGGVFASNTSTLPITGLAKASKAPENFIGLHYFSPAEKMPLVEIIVGEQTSPETLARAFDYVLAIGKTPIVVNDSRGFYTSRVFGTYVMEGIALLAEGNAPSRIEAAGKATGMPMPPLALQDEVSLSLGWHVAEQTRKDLEAEGKPVPVHPGLKVIDKMVNELDRPGKKAGKGFYDYDGKKKSLWSGLAKHYPTADTQLSVQDMKDRLLYAQAIETARCVEEGVVLKTNDANIGSIFGWGFAPWSGGTLQYINQIGLPQFVARAQQLADQYGERFAPPQLLKDMAEKGQRFE